jgi:hypothetical protein
LEVGALDFQRSTLPCDGVCKTTNAEFGLSSTVNQGSSFINTKKEKKWNKMVV